MITRFRVEKYTKKLYGFALEYFNNFSYEYLKEIIDIMFDKLMINLTY